MQEPREPPCRALGLTEADSGEVVSESEDSALGREIVVLGVERVGSRRFEEACDDDEDRLREDLLADTVWLPRMKLALIEVVGFLELEELLRFPSLAVELGDRSA